MLLGHRILCTRPTNDWPWTFKWDSNFGQTNSLSESDQLSTLDWCCILGSYLQLFMMTQNQTAKRLDTNSTHFFQVRSQVSPLHPKLTADSVWVLLWSHIGGTWLSWDESTKTILRSCVTLHAMHIIIYYNMMHYWCIHDVYAAGTCGELGMICALVWWWESWLDESCIPGFLSPVMRRATTEAT